MPTIKNRVPYELTIMGYDNTSNKRVSTVFHLRNKVQTVGAPAYAAPIAGPSSTATLLANFRTLWKATILPLLSGHLYLDQYLLKSITGWSVGGIPRTVFGATNTNPIVIDAATNHNLINGDTVVIAGVTGNVAANGTWVITVVDATKFSIPVAGTGLFTGGGTWTLQNTTPRLTYGESEVLVPPPGADTGGVAGEALPLFATMSVFFRGNKAGRNFRGGARMSPIAESDSNNGAVVPARQTARINAWNTYAGTALANGGSDATSSEMEQDVFSKTLALQAVSPFTDSDPFMANIVGYIPRPNDGSIVRRKPKLDAPIYQT